MLQKHGVCLCIIITCLILTISCSDESTPDNRAPEIFQSPTNQRITITGTVYDGNLIPVPYCVVLAGNYYTLCDRNGRYEIRDLPRGTLCVTARYNYAGIIVFAATKIAESNRFDLILPVHFYTSSDYSWGRICGGVSGISAGWPYESSVLVMSISRDGRFVQQTLDAQNPTFSLGSVQSGLNTLLGLEYGDDGTSVVGYHIIPDFSVASGSETRQDLMLRSGGLQTVRGTFPASYLNYETRVATWIAFNGDGFPDVAIKTRQLELSTGSQNQFVLSSIPTPPTALPLLTVSCETTRNGYVSMFQTSQFYNPEQTVVFTEPPAFLTLSGPDDGESNVGDSPAFEWSGDGQVFELHLEASGHSRLIFWTIETQDHSFTLPVIDGIPLKAMDTVSGTLSTSTPVSDSFPTVDPNQTTDWEITTSFVSFSFHPGDDPQEKASQFSSYRPSPFASASRPIIEIQ